MRMAKGGKAGPVVTDNGNFVIDAPFAPEAFEDPHSVRPDFFGLCSSGARRAILDCELLKLLSSIKMLTGVVEVGLFCQMAQAAYFGNAVCA